jgi:ribonucleoside-diphosphate reductase alpha chain
MVSTFQQRLDPAHRDMDFFDLPVSYDVWRDKYKWKEDQNVPDMCLRVATAVNGRDGVEHVDAAYQAMVAGLWIPAGRILAGAGTAKRVTLINCFVNTTVEDTMEGIMHSVSNVALTMQQGGGMGTDASTIRPEGAILRRTYSQASGPLPFIDVYNQTSKTIRSAGDRRGAMMTTLCDTHPDLPKFIRAKRKKGRMTETNVSVLVSDALMEALAEDEDWLLYFHVEPWHREDQSLVDLDFEDENGAKQYVYSRHKARDIWKMILENTYEYSEPGVIFIDRVNDLNNLKHVEEIRCTNPCGEQPLPPHGACDLGHANIARMVKHPFTDKASFDWELLRDTVRIGQRFLDNVLDETGYPLPEQESESIRKRRTGLGITGLADALAMLRIRYGSPRSCEFAEAVMREVCLASYDTSIRLAEEKGPCPSMTPEMIAKHNVLHNGCFIDQRLPQEYKERIKVHGLRNGVLNTVAPTGTISVVFGYTGSGCETWFARKHNRKVRQSVEGESDAYKTYTDIEFYGQRLFHKMFGQKTEEPGYMVTTEDLVVDEHVAVQAAMQRWTDASISKTVNMPKETDYDDFARVYDLAYALGCKGCTTYRPSDVRGSILSVEGEDGEQKTAETIAKRPEVLAGCTYQIRWPKREAALYLTINHNPDGTLGEILVSSKDTSSFEWVTALTLMMTAIFKKGGDVSFVPQELKQVQAVADSGWAPEPGNPEKNSFYGSLVAYIGAWLEWHMGMKPENGKPSMIAQPIGMQSGETCPKCKAPAVIRSEGCKKCTNCDYSTCA